MPQMPNPEVVPVDLVVCFTSQRKVTFPVLRVVAGASRWWPGVAMAMGASLLPGLPPLGPLNGRAGPLSRDCGGPSAAMYLVHFNYLRGETPKRGSLVS